MVWDSVRNIGLELQLALGLELVCCRRGVLATGFEDVIDFLHFERR